MGFPRIKEKIGPGSQTCASIGNKWSQTGAGQKVGEGGHCFRKIQCIAHLI